jgi:hypothetical protein
MIERRQPDGRDRQTIDHARNDHHPAGATVSRDGNGAICGRANNPVNDCQVGSCGCSGLISSELVDDLVWGREPAGYSREG